MSGANGQHDDDLVLREAITRAHQRMHITVPDNPHNLHSMAMAYRRRGFSVIPVDAKKKSHRGLEWTEFQTEIAPESTVREWFQDPTVKAIGIITGAVSGDLFVRDYDILSRYDEWAAAHPDLAHELPTAKTPRGAHVYGSFKVDGILTGEDGELRGNGGYVLAPPSLDGKYKWIVPLPPEGQPIPAVDPVTAGLWVPKSCNREGREHREDREHTENREDPRGTKRTERTERTESIQENRRDGREIRNTDFAVALEEVIRNALPKAPGQRHKAVFRLCRGLKGMPELKDAGFPKLRPYVVRWHKAALPFIQTKPFDETWADFVDGWERVQFAGQGPLELALARADNGTLPPQAAAYETPQLRRLVALCRELGALDTTGLFYLGSRSAASVLQVIDASTVHRWLKMMAADCIIQVVEVGENRPGGRATRYRWMGGTK